MSRQPFQPTPDDRDRVEAMVGFGIPEANICRLIKNPQTGKPIDAKTLRKHFEAEIALGISRLCAEVGEFIVNTILGRTRKATVMRHDKAVEVEVPLGLVDERARAALAMFFAKTRMHWRETSIHQHTGMAGGDPIEFKNAETDLDTKINSLFACSTTGEVSEESE